MRQTVDIKLGDRGGRLVVIGRVRVPRPSRPNGRGRIVLVCRCDCGAEALVNPTHFGRDTCSCGCLRREVTAQMARSRHPSEQQRERMGTVNLIHGHARHGRRHPLYGTWCSMRQRCNNPNATDYYLYGGRGITIDPAWDSFAQFLADLEPTWPGPGMGYTLDRINGDSNYGPGLCRWATALEQARERDSRRAVMA